LIWCSIDTDGVIHMKSEPYPESSSEVQNSGTLWVRA